MVVALTSGVLFVSIACLFYAFPAFAAATKSAVKSSAKTGTLKKKKRGVMAFMKKVIDGANTKDSLKGMKVGKSPSCISSSPSFTFRKGDTRSEFATLINTFSAFIFLGFMGAVATLYTSIKDFSDKMRAQKEVKRINEYKENMYFEAVAEIQEKLAEPNIKGSTKASLLKQLRELDPDGRISKFLSEGGTRPDMSDLINKKSSKKTSSSKKPIDTNKRSTGAAKSTAKVEDEESSSSDEPYEQLLDALFESLSGKIDRMTRSRLRDSLRERIERISDPEKRNASVGKIAEKLGDTEYWVEYARKLFGSS